ncbi:MAG: NADH dehydrogenase subunit, partial [Pseudomonadota bacterium]
LRGDRNPNTRGLRKALEDQGIKSQWNDLVSSIEAGKIETLVVAGPENLAVFDDVDEKVALFGKVANLAWLGAPKIEALHGIQNNRWLVPLRTFIEKSGTYINFEGKEQKVKAGPTFVSNAVTLSSVAAGLHGQGVSEEAQMVTGLKTNHFTSERGEL